MVDYKGQALAERYLVLCFVAICTPAWIVGYVQQDFSVPFRAWVAATLVAALLVLPDWGMYNRHPIKWLSSAMYVAKPKEATPTEVTPTDATPTDATPKSGKPKSGKPKSGKSKSS